MNPLCVLSRTMKGCQTRLTRNFDCLTFRSAICPKVVEILCNHEGTAVSSGLSEYFGDSEETVVEAVANEQRTGVAAAYGVDGGPLLSDVLTPPKVRFVRGEPPSMRS